ncbi:virescein-like [Melitaea cinxia]|uniref:virescein-like n=1 Tax=Melitaea cinxia TaxID=113334 RepID=UPI001E26F603|nr:virescein-like [Melitaea cinxia]
MKFSIVFMMLMTVLAVFVGQSSAAPKINVNALRKGGRALKKGLGIIGAAGTAHEVYNHIRNRKH